MPDLPDTMRVVEISEFGGPEVLKPGTRPVPTPGAGEILIKVAASGVNRPDALQRMGNYPVPPGASDLPGLEAAGTVAAVGEGVGRWKVGDKVCALLPGGGYAEYAVTPADHALPVPEGLSMEAAACLPETVFTVWINAFRRVGLKGGETFLVHGGSSGIGSTAIQLAAARGVRVFTTVGNAEKAEFCRGLGAEAAINYREQDFVEEVKALTDGRGVDVILDMVGGDYINRDIKALADDGRLSFIAFLGGPKAEVNFAQVMIRRLTITGSTLRPRSIAFKAETAREIEAEVWPLVEAGRLAPVIHARFPLEEAAKAHALMESSAHMGKIVLTL
ncbi:NAD(P)H-quinone oxidoreductase [Albimonas pacifica]|uniref:Putative NAD(P)H quinone oxidoreductase, PIG3 family n=1 Tax=Albimonas pacifica TaxID=1114924 RepID=A0A1I3N0L3_9RHOB|nr:NAD(P)H-quinone oxidoreductase [Albimonas pacifica]SFJ02769.1 putative NAD(P)H quinone oxidoreductase, PIG3 family [Albimonas pacifica]